MMKRIFTLLLLLFLTLCGCARQDDTAERWYAALDRLKQRENYTVEEVTAAPEGVTYRLRQYDLLCARTQEPEETLYFSAEGSTCFGIGWVEDPGIWAKKELENSGLYFYDYQVLDRLNQISGFIDMGLLTYHPEIGTFVGSDLTQRYVYRDLEHTPIKLEVTVFNGQISGIHEIWKCTKDGKDLGIYEDTTKIFDVGTTIVSLPADVIAVENEE